MTSDDAQRAPVSASALRALVPSAPAMHELGSALAAALRAGDLVVLSGPLGAGKTTLVQGIARGLGVRGEVTSPTFVISRIHDSLTAGPALVHVDAYRLGGTAELDDLDLDADLDRAVTVVEWGTGLAEVLAEHRLEVVIDRAEDSDVRTVELRPVGQRWARDHQWRAAVAAADLGPLTTA